MTDNSKNFDRSELQLLSSNDKYNIIQQTSNLLRTTQKSADSSVEFSQVDQITKLMINSTNTTLSDKVKDYSYNLEETIKQLNENNILNEFQYVTINAFIEDFQFINSLETETELIKKYQTIAIESNLTNNQVEQLIRVFDYFDILFKASYNVLASDSQKASNDSEMASKIVDGMFCGFTIIGWGIAAVSLVTLAPAASLLTLYLTGVGYSVATASLASCALLLKKIKTN